MMFRVDDDDRAPGTQQKWQDCNYTGQSDSAQRFCLTGRDFDAGEVLGWSWPLMEDMYTVDICIIMYMYNVYDDIYIYRLYTMIYIYIYI